MGKDIMPTFGARSKFPHLPVKRDVAVQPEQVSTVNQPVVEQKVLPATLPHFSAMVWQEKSSAPFNWYQPTMEQDDQFNRPVDSRYFKSAYVINLKRRPEKLAAFYARFPKDWDFLRPMLFYGIDGAKTGSDDRYHHGSWGCMQSHLAIMERAMSEDALPCIVFEDDFDPYENFTQRMHTYLNHLPSDYRLAYFGGQHLHLEVERPVNINEYVAKPFDVNRTHGMIFNNSKGLAEIYNRLRFHCDYDPANGHIDHNLGRWMETHRPWGIYTPADEKWFGGQVGGFSDISNKEWGAFQPGK